MTLNAILKAEPKTQSEVIYVLGQITKIQQTRAEGYIRNMPPGANAELLRKQVNLKNVLKKFGMRKATGEDAKAVEEHWKRHAEAEKIKQEDEKKAEKKRLELAKTQVKAEMSNKLDEIADMVKGLSPEKRKELMKQLKS